MAFLQLRDFDLDLVELTLGIFEGDTQPFSLLRCGDICLRSRIIGGRPISEDSCGSPCGKLASIRTPGVPLPAWRLSALQARFRDHTIRIFTKHHMTSVGYRTPQDSSTKDKS